MTVTCERQSQTLSGYIRPDDVKERNNIIMTQERIAKRLKLLTAFLGVAGLGVFGLLGRKIYMAYFALSADGRWDPGLVPERIHISASHLIPFLMLIITMVLCYAVLYRFYCVCNEIGRDNSFSRENVRNFAWMKVLLLVLGGIWAGYAIAFLIVNKGGYLVMVGRAAIFSVIFFTIAAFAGALSKLIERAFEIREENDLTI